MWRDKRFVAVRDPKLGGLIISKTTEEFDEETKEEISRSCLELITLDKDKPATCIYTMENGDHLCAMAKWIDGNSRESRQHEIVRGVIVEKGELADFCKRYMTKERMRQTFFPDDFDKEDPENWRIASLENMPRGYVKPIDMLNGIDAIHLSGAIKEISTKHLKVKLSVPEDTELDMLAVLGCVAEASGVGLYAIADGECTMKEPDVLISDIEPVYQDMESYRKLDFEQLISLGSNIGEGMLSEKEEINLNNRKKAEMLGFCIRYMEDTDISDSALYAVLGDFRLSNSMLFDQLMLELKEMLHMYPVSRKTEMRYMKLLYIAFKKPASSEMRLALELETAPYDFAGMEAFINMKTRNKRERRRLLCLMLECQFQECLSFLRERVLKAASRKSVINK